MTEENTNFHPPSITLHPFDVVIVGAGPAGISAALWTKRLGCYALLIEAGSRLGGQLLRSYNTSVDCPGFFELTGDEIAKRLAEHLAAINITPQLNSPVTQILAAQRTVWCGAEAITAQALILALGVHKRRLDVPGEKEFDGRGVSTSVTRDGLQYRGKPVVIVGGGDGACEEALMLAEMGCSVTLVHRSDRFRARPMYRDPVCAHPHIRVFTHSRITRILGDESVNAVEIQISPPDEDSQMIRLVASGVFLTLGTQAATQLVAGQVECDPEGYMVTNRTGATSVPGVWAAGDACHPLLPSLATAFGDGATAAKAAYEWLRSRQGDRVTR